MKITKQKIESLGPCIDGYNWYLFNGTEDLLETLLKVNEERPSWVTWALLKLMSKIQYLTLSIFSSEQILHLFENKYPNDKRPRLAIEAAKAVLFNNTEENRRICAKAEISAMDASNDVYNTEGFHNCDSYSNAAYAAARAARDVFYSYTNYTYTDNSFHITKLAALECMTPGAGRKSLEELIIKEAVRILEEE